LPHCLRLKIRRDLQQLKYGTLAVWSSREAAVARCLLSKGSHVIVHAATTPLPY